VALAVADAVRSETYAERSGEEFQRIASRATHATALHEAGCQDEAAALFREAEAMQAGDEPECPLLYSLRGFQYCDLLLAAAERAAWRRMFNLSRIQQYSSLPESCRAIFERATQTIKIHERNNWRLFIALDHLTLGRATLYGASGRQTARTTRSGAASPSSTPWRASTCGESPAGKFYRLDSSTPASSGAAHLGLRPRLRLDNDATGIIVTTAPVEKGSVFQGPHNEPNNWL
jgi:hypothetical protein